MDCVEYMKTLPDDTIDLTVTSPPYDNLRTYNGYTFDYKKTLSELFRVTKRGGIVVWVVNDQTVDGSESGTSFKQRCLRKNVDSICMIR
jgi:site-specific DNA-methyltransferase (adenine-specific)